MALHYPSSPRQDLIAPPPKLHPAAATRRYYDPSEDLAAEAEEWFFNMKIHDSHPGAAPSPSPRSPRKPKQLDPVTVKPHHHHRPKAKASGGTKAGQGRISRDQGRTSRDGGRPQFRGKGRAGKLQSLCTPSPAELREQIDLQTARSIGDSLIFHNIPERSNDTPEDEVVKFCQDYLVGHRRVKHVQFGHVHKMEPRFAKNAPIAARFTLLLPPSADQPEAEKYQPLPYIPAVPKRRLPLLKTKSRRKAQYNVD
ncbi:uncharacterized protein LOC143301498 [Babylonia areolata]|uniref:uncharacterized protein LOC143301498 n=1 Tax=Babylonia areolata TaxID=304850 RepID=UPI003FD142B2